MKKRPLTMVVTGIMTAAMSMTAFAGTWQQDTTGWKYQNDDGSYQQNGWYQDTDGKYYYFNQDGYMLANTTTPDGYTVDSSGAWVTGNTTASNTGLHSVNYDPAHPLSCVIDKWDLRIADDSNSLNFDFIHSRNIHALLTGQMQYYIPWTASVEYGRSEEKATRLNTEEQAIYQWFCNWLNGFDFENMSEMERASEIKKTLSQSVYDTSQDTSDRDDIYTVLINKTGVCAEYAMTNAALSRSVGLKHSLNGTGNHAVFYVQVDGIWYFGENNYLNLDTPTPDNVYAIYN